MPWDYGAFIWFPFIQQAPSETVILGQDNHMNPYVQTCFSMIMHLMGQLGPGKRKSKQ